MKILAPQITRFCDKVPFYQLTTKILFFNFNFDNKGFPKYDKQ